MTAALMTADEYFKQARSLGPSELVRGRVRKKSYGDMGHGLACGNLIGLLGNHAAATKSGRIYSLIGLVVETDPDSVRSADAAFLSYSKMPRNSDKGPDGFLRLAPELVAEVKNFDETWAELERKVAEFHTFGVEMVWVADPAARTIKTYPRKGEGFVLNRDDLLNGDGLLSSFNCSVSSIFED